MTPLTLGSLMSDIEHDVASGADIAVTGIAYRSDEVTAGDVFFCVPGFVHDGHDFAADAVQRGAVALVVKHVVEGLSVPQAVTSDVRHALAMAADLFHGHPSGSMDVIGITGTNGKTTTSFLVESVLRAAGRTTGLAGTVEVRVADDRRPAGRTTPESADLQALLAEMLSKGVDAAVMEVSSHAIDLRRVDGVRFAVTAFTNLTQDHLDYHSSMEEYFAVKKRLFTEMSTGPRVVDIDTEAGATLATECGAEWTVGFADEAMVRAEDLVLASSRSSFNLRTPAGDVAVVIPLAGRYNVSNALLAAACGLALDIDIGAVAEGLRDTPQVPGRLERVDCGQGFGVFVDYAHSPDGLSKAISAVRDVTTGKVITVFGCGGDRDPEKRPMMGEVAARLSDWTVVTSDNPRSEDPVGIILHIEDGMREYPDGYEVEIDRRKAIECALTAAGPGDSVLLAGKGHEDYQIFADRTIHFDDREVVREVLGC